MTPRPAALGAIREEPVGGLGGARSETSDAARRNSCTVKAGGHCGVEVKSPRFGPRKCTKGVNELRHDFGAHFIVAGPDVRPDISSDVGPVALRDNCESRNRFPWKRCEGAPPTCMHHCHRRTWRHENDGDTVGEAQRKGNTNLASDYGVGPRKSWGSRRSERARAGRVGIDNRDVNAVHLLGHCELISKRPQVQGVQKPTTILVDRSRVVVHVRSEVEAIERTLAHPPTTLRECDEHARITQESLIDPGSHGIRGISYAPRKCGKHACASS